VNIELKNVRKDGLGYWGFANVYFMYDKTLESELGGVKFLEENILVEFGYNRVDGELKILHFEIFHRSKHFDEHFNFSALERFKRALMQLCETAAAAKICL